MVTANFSGQGSAGNFLEVSEIWLENMPVIRYFMLLFVAKNSDER